MLWPASMLSLLDVLIFNIYTLSTFFLVRHTMLSSSYLFCHIASTVQIPDAIRDIAEGFSRMQYGAISKLSCTLALVILFIYLFHTQMLVLNVNKFCFFSSSWAGHESGSVM
jgi:hypothetical protein